MHNIKDLNIQSEILPLFDFTLNSFAKDALLKILQIPLSSTLDIEIRQNILKGFIANLEIFNHYTYPRADFHEVHAFLTDPSTQKLKSNTIFKSLFPEREWLQTRARLVQFVVLFSRLHRVYFKRISTNAFSEEYKKELLKLNAFFSSFDLERYDELIRENKFRRKHINELAVLISELQAKGEVTEFYKRLFIFESYLSISKAIVDSKFCFPNFSQEGISIDELYHPLIKDAKKNSFASGNNVILLTGPNMSGKSTFLRAVGLCIYLAHLGIGVPATKVEIPFFDHLSISINHNDDIFSGYSHFMSELMRLKQVLVEANNNKKCFAVFDELFKGTNIEDAVQISSTTIKGLINLKNSVFFISTHLHQLKEVEEIKNQQVDTYKLDCDIVNGVPVFNYEVKDGWSDLKVGQILFDKEGLNDLLR